MADDTPVSRSGKPSGEDSRLAKADDIVETEVPVATEDDIVAFLKQEATEYLRPAVVAGETRWLLRQVKSDCLASSPAKICELSEASLIELASPIFWARIARNKKFKDELKEASKQYDAVYDGDAWTAKVVTPGSANEQYEQWLDSGNALEPLPRGIFFSVTRPNSGDSRRRSSRPYELSAEPGHSYGAVVIKIEDGCLKLLCELAGQLGIAAIACTHHIMMRERAMEPSKLLDSTSPKLSNQRFELNGLAIKNDDEHGTIRLDLDFHNRTGATQDALDQARARMTCLRLRSCFVVLVTEATRPLPGLNLDRFRFPSLPSVPLQSLKFMYFVERLFDDALNVRRLWSVPDTWTQYKKEHTLEWLLIISTFIGEISVLAGTIQRLDYEVVTLSSVTALSDIKKLRARVARLRADMDRSSHMFRFFDAHVNSYPGPKSGTRKSEAPSIHVAPTERELASISYASEYAWMDKQAADLMVLLNQALQLVVAQISIEQTAASLEMSNIMARDSAIGIKNGERSTQLTLLAAIYLPLTLATGIFGMNITEINDGTPRFWWAIVVAVLLLIPSGIFITYILLISRRDKRPEQQKDQDLDDQDEMASIFSLSKSKSKPLSRGSTSRDPALAAAQANDAKPKLQILEIEVRGLAFVGDNINFIDVLNTIMTSSFMRVREQV
ncbi:unnamed protein product [Zymoseptoria tritici ST99CH_3D7]|uniref:Uncharacterized protein n=1 Tax=Zymoseptoria tritici (strain ST99CH_3D7) TaxID=1276538 RepID=A0A1X7S561_ZYMT9|nr:unnamed protein product [Zymoseptoria tritici ST99CH_3D7]